MCSSSTSEFIFKAQIKPSQNMFSSKRLAFLQQVEFVVKCTVDFSIASRISLKGAPRAILNEKKGPLPPKKQKQTTTTTKTCVYTHALKDHKGMPKVL